MNETGHLLGGSLLEQLVVEAVRDHNVLPLTGQCNLDCIFCSHHQNPPKTRAYSFSPLSPERLGELMHFLDGSKKIIIGESATRLREGEPLSYPCFAPLLKRLRSVHPRSLIQVTTNGALLGPNHVSLFKDLQPLEVILSLNSASQKGRRLLMNDSRPEKAIRTVELLHRAAVPFHGSVVALPHLAGWDDLSATLNFFERFGAQSVRVLLPGYTRCSKPRLVPPVGTAEKCRKFICDLQAKLTLPLILEPPLLENLDPMVEGVITGSPAAGAGILKGDLIQSIDGKKPLSRVDAYNIANRSEDPTLSLLRAGRSLSLNIKKKQGQSSGLVMAYDLDPGQVERVRRSMALSARTLMLLSEPALGLWQKARIKFNLGLLDLLAVPSAYFGGSINAAGLLTTADFQAALDGVYNLSAFAAILLPAAPFDQSGYDLGGGHYLALNSRKTPLRLIT